MSDRYLYMIALEGLGRGTGASSSELPGCIKIAMDVPTATEDPDGYYFTGLDNFPKSIGEEVNFQNGDAFVSSQVVTIQKDILDTTIQKALCYRYNVTGDTLYESIDADVLDDTIKLVNGNYAEGDVIRINKENILLGAKSSGSGHFIYSNCDRGVNDTDLGKHDITQNDEVFLVYDESLDEFFWDIKKYRRFYILKVDRNSPGYDAEEVVFRGLVTGFSENSHSITISADSVLDSLEGKEILTDPIVLTPQAPSIYNIKWYYQGELKPFGKESSTVSWNGTGLFKTQDGTILKLAYSGPRSDSIGNTFDTFTQIGIDLRYYRTEYNTPRLPDRQDFTTESLKLTEIMVSDPNLGVGDATDYTTVPYSNNPFIQALQMLMTSEHGNNGDYDMGDSRLGIAQTSKVIDIAKFEEFALKYAAVTYDNYIFDQPIDVLEHIREMLRPLGCLVGSSDGGKIAPVEIKDIASLVSTVSLDELDFDEGDTENIDHSLGDPYSVISAEIGGVEGVIEPIILKITDFRQRKLYFYAKDGIKQISLKGLRHDEQRLARTLCHNLINRWRDPVPTITFSIYENNIVTPLWVGDGVVISHAYMSRKTGVDGLSNVYAEIEAREEDEETGIIKYRAKLFGEVYNKVGLVAPSLKVLSWDGGTKTATVETEEYGINAGTGWNDTFYMEGYFTKLMVLDKDTLEVKSPSGTYGDILAIDIDSATNTVQFHGSFAGTLVQGDVIVPGSHINVHTAGDIGLDYYAYMANSDDELGITGGAFIEGYEYTFN